MRRIAVGFFLGVIASTAFAVDLPRRRPSRPPAPPPINDCTTALSAYQSAVAEIRQFVRTPVDVPPPPKVDYNCSAGETDYAYVESVMGPERIRLENLTDIGRRIDLLGCPAVSLDADMAPLLSRLEAKEKLLPPLGDTPDKHMPILTAMVEIERKLQLVGPANAGDPTLIANTAAAWLPSDEQYYLKRITEQHDYTGASTAINLARVLFMLTDVDPNLQQLFSKLQKAMTFRLKITIEGTSTFVGITSHFKSSSESVIEGVGIKNPSGGPITIREEKGTAAGFGQTCTYTPGADSNSGVYLPFDPCGNPAIKVLLQGVLGSAPGTWSCPAGMGPPPIGGNLDTIARVAFKVNPIAMPPEVVSFDGQHVRAPTFHNLSATPVDDVWAGSGTWNGVNCQAEVHITMAHEPKQ